MILHVIIYRCHCPRQCLTRNHITMPMSQTWSYM
ncbi:Protein spire [Gossypium arboreum]|uniref:Protein spire n=1 Tax=Gossypium arboreum TaxID=29729 RepID=A0A0B0PAM0_GOSAR|nr:Protein spire [Gossypium arboreum]